MRDIHPIQYESCSICQKRFTKRHCLVMHVRTVHKNLSQDERNKLLMVPEKDENVKSSGRKKTTTQKTLERCMLERCDVTFENT